MNKKLKVGIIGCGGIANSKHMPGLKSVEEAEMVAFCDLEIERAEKAKAEYGTPDAKVYKDYKELLKDALMWSMSAHPTAPTASFPSTLCVRESMSWWKSPWRKQPQKQKKW